MSMFSSFLVDAFNCFRNTQYVMLTAAKVFYEIVKKQILELLLCAQNNLPDE